jgi:hypothetical protein
MSNSSEVSYIRATDQLETVKYPDPSVIGAVYNAATKSLSELTQSMFDAIDDSLFELANNARSNNEQNRFFEAMRDVRIKRQTIENHFQQQVKSLFEPKSVLTVNSSSAQPDASSKETLALVGETDMELGIAINSMASKTNSNFQKTLLDTQHCFGQLYGAKNPALVSSPLSPQKICNSFSEACASLEVDLKEQLLILKQFDRFVMAHYDEVLKQSLSKLAASGIAPPAQHTHTHRPNTSNTHKQGADTPSAHSTAVDSQTQNSSDFAKLLAAFQQDTSSQQSRTGSVRISTPSEEMQRTLDKIQQNALSQLKFNGENTAPMNLSALIESEIDARHSKLSQYDNDLINLVSMLFEFILQDYNLAPSMQTLISRMQLPILKVVVQDKSFFNSNTHPARHLLNSLAKAGISWTETQRKEHDQLYIKIQQIVHRTLDDFDGDLRLFSELNQDLSQFLSQEERRSSLVEQRTREAEEGRIKSIKAQEKVELTLRRQILSAHHSLPELVIDTLKNGWSRVMFLAYLKDEQEHQWTNTVEISRELIWCLQPLTAPKDRQRWISIVPKLLKDLEAGLRNVSYNSANIDQNIADIKTELTSSFKDSSYTQASPKRAKPLKNDNAIETHPNHQEIRKKSSQNSNTSLAQYIEKVNSLEVGQWVEFKLVNGNTYRCKLSANIEEAECLIFVNRMGLKPLKKSYIELAQDLQKNRVIFLEQGPIIDRALSTLATNLRPNKKY